MAQTIQDVRAEHDLLGWRDVPADAYWGVHTLRATENFGITHVPIAAFTRLIEALAAIKKAAAVTNTELGLIDAGMSDVICAACDEVMAGVVSLPHGYGHAREGIRLQVAADHAGASVNDLSDDQRVDALSGNAALSGVPVQVAAAASPSTRAPRS